jgi:hypothetical protein
MKSVFAYIPKVPGAVRLVEDTVPPATKSNKTADWYQCWDVVVVGWNFDGHSFTPPVQGIDSAGE